MNNAIVLYMILILADIALIGTTIVLASLAVDNIDFIKSKFQKIKRRFEKWKSNF